MIHLFRNAAALQGPVLEEAARRDELRPEDGIGPGVELTFFARDFAPQHRKATGVSVIENLDDLRPLVREPEVALVEDERPADGVEEAEERRDRRGAAREDRLVADGADREEDAVFPVPGSPRRRRYGSSLKPS